MQILGDAPPQPSKEQLLAALKEPIQKLIKEEVSGDMDQDRIYLYKQVLKNEKYWRGQQYLIPSMDYATGTMSYGSVKAPRGDDGQSIDVYDHVQNIYRGTGKKFIAVLGQRSPNVKCVADDPHDEESVHRTHLADTAATILDAKWRSDQKNMQIAQGLWISGVQFLHTPFVSDAEKYGTREEPQYEPQPMGDATSHCLNCGADSQASGDCPQCGSPIGQQSEAMNVPQMTGTTKYPNGMVEFHIYDLSSVTIPRFATEDDCLWLKNEREVHKAKLLRTYPQLRAMDSFNVNSPENSNSDQYGQQVRSQIASPSGTNGLAGEKNSGLKEIWITTPMYEMLPDQNLRNLLASHFPTGVKVTMVGEETVQLDDEKLSDVWAFVKPECTRYILCDPAGQDMMPAQDMTNHFINIAEETVDRGVSVTLAKSNIIDQKRWGSSKGLPAEIIFAKPDLGESLSDSMYQIPPAQFSNQMLPFLQGIQGQANELVGVIPAIWGGDAGQEKTARQAELDKNAALQQLGMLWLGMRMGWEKAKTNAVKQLARFGTGVLKGSKKTQNGDESLILECAELKEDGWHFEAEEAIPETWGQKRDLLMWMMSQPPNIVQAWGFTHPLNIEEDASLLGYEGHYIPGLDQVTKVRGTIQDLLRQKAVQPPPGPPGAPPQPPQPSIQPDWEDDPSMTVALVKAWCLSDAGRAAKTSNLEAYGNVLAYGKACEAKVPPPPGPPPPPPPNVSFTGKFEDMPDMLVPVLASHGVKVPPPQPPAPPMSAAPQLPIQ